MYVCVLWLLLHRKENAKKKKKIPGSGKGLFGAARRAEGKPQGMQNSFTFTDRRGGGGALGKVPGPLRRRARQ